MDANIQLDEIWKKIDGFENYSVSTFGNVRNDKSNKLLNVVNCGKFDSQYYYVGLHKDKEQHNFRVHRLVAVAFIENPDNKEEVDHIDKNRFNNHANNLRWATRSENMRNKNKRANLTSKYKGVHLHSKYPKYMSGIKINKKYNYLGYYDTEEEAALAYNNHIIKNGLQEFFILNEIN